MTSLPFKKIGAFAILSLLLLVLFAPASLAAQGGLFDTLDTIKAKSDVKVIDFSEGRIWGNLPPDTQTVLTNLGYAKLDELIQKAETARTGGISYENFLKGVEGMTDASGALNDHGKRILGEIQYQGESQIQAVILAVAKVFRNLMGALGMIFVVIAGIQMIFAQGDEAKITEQKHAITYTLIGLVILLILERMINAIYGVPGEVRTLTPESAMKVNLEIYGLISYMKAILGSVAIFMIVLSGIKTIFAQGEEAEITNQRKAILWTIVGLVLILVNKVVVQNIFINPVQKNQGQIAQSNVQNILNLFGKVLQFLLGFVGLFALAALIYGAGSLVANFGNEEAVGKAKKIITNALIGIVIILSAFAIVSTVIL